MSKTDTANRRTQIEDYPEWMTADDVAEYLDVTLRTVQRYTREKVIKRVYLLGGNLHPRYPRSQFDPAERDLEVAS